MKSFSKLCVLTLILGLISVQASYAETGLFRGLFQRVSTFSSSSILPSLPKYCGQAVWASRSFTTTPKKPVKKAGFGLVKVKTPAPTPTKNQKSQSSDAPPSLASNYSSSIIDDIADPASPLNPIHPMSIHPASIHSHYNGNSGYSSYSDDDSSDSSDSSSSSDD